jgi:hypothetical protein
VLGHGNFLHVPLPQLHRIGLRLSLGDLRRLQVLTQCLGRLPSLAGLRLCSFKPVPQRVSPSTLAIPARLCPVCPPLSIQELPQGPIGKGLRCIGSLPQGADFSGMRRFDC